MRLVRAMMALVIALSVAMLPAAGVAVSMVKSASQAATETTAKDMAVASDMSGAKEECCRDHVKAKPCDQSGGRCPLVFCAAQPVNLALSAAFRFDFLMVAGNPLPIPMDQVVTLHDSSPPFRPPRV
jgi:hypothetical protein